MKNYFPQGIVTHKAFCNRHKERAALVSSIKMHEHIVLVAPRRYGKTSLITQVLEENDFPGSQIDLFFVLTQGEVVQTISEGISKIISMLLPKSKSAAQGIINTIVALNPKLTFNVFGQKLEISTKQSTEKSISELLLALDQFAVKANKSCVVILDEFQQVGELKESHGVEAAIRHAVERSKNVSYIFCGSKRHLLNKMFSDKSRPLYHLCDLMNIDRISSESYITFLKEMADKKWGKSLSLDAIHEILHLTENHPYYVNALCRRLWHAENIPTLSDAMNTWAEYVNQQAEWITDDLSSLTLNRRKVLTALALQPTHAPLSQAFSLKSELGTSGIQKCLNDLKKMDMIFITQDEQYRVLDPAIAYFIRQHSSRS